jgi:hypothetical protein
MDDIRYIKVDIKVIEDTIATWKRHGIPEDRINVIVGQSNQNWIEEYKKQQIRKLRELKIKRIFDEK